MGIKLSIVYFLVFIIVIVVYSKAYSIKPLLPRKCKRCGHINRSWNRVTVVLGKSYWEHICK